jgi:hypothetical protein
MLESRAHELSVINGHPSGDAHNFEIGQAQRELTGGLEADPKTTILESAPESERWDPLPGSSGGKVPSAQSEDEDAEGRSDDAKLVEEGIAEAEHDQMLQASKASAKSQ